MRNLTNFVISRPIWLTPCPYRRLRDIILLSHVWLRGRDDESSQFLWTQSESRAHWPLDYSPEKERETIDSTPFFAAGLAYTREREKNTKEKHVFHSATRKSTSSRIMWRNWRMSWRRRPNWFNHFSCASNTAEWSRQGASKKSTARSTWSWTRFMRRIRRVTD